MRTETHSTARHHYEKSSATTIKSPALVAALRWIDDGFRVLPIQPRNKRPAYDLVPRGATDATTDVTRVVEWFGKQPDNGLGVALDDHLLVDVDVHPATKGKPAVDGWDAFADLCERELIPEGAYQQKTPRNGLHVVAALPDGLTLPKQDGEICDGVDYKTGNQYFATAMHFEGKPYVELGGDHSVEVPIGLLLDIRTRVGNGNGARTETRDLGSGAATSSGFAQRWT